MDIVVQYMFYSTVVYYREHDIPILLCNAGQRQSTWQSYLIKLTRILSPSKVSLTKTVQHTVHLHNFRGLRIVAIFTLIIQSFDYVFRLIYERINLSIY